MQYDGTLIVVSHDRDFLDGLTDRLYEFRNKKIKEYRGNIFHFLEKRKLSTLKEIEQKNKEKLSSKAKNVTNNKLSYIEKKEFERNKRKIINQIKKAEERINTFEQKIKEADKLLSDGNSAEDADFYENYEKQKKQLEQEMQNWETLQFELDQFEQNG